MMDTNTEVVLDTSIEAMAHADAEAMLDTDTEVMLTTFDNPYDPFDDFVKWFLFDVEQGYYTCSLLARIAKGSEEFSSVEEKADTERAIDEIINHDFLNIYKKVTRTVEKNDAS